MNVLLLSFDTISNRECVYGSQGENDFKISKHLCNSVFQKLKNIFAFKNG